MIAKRPRLALELTLALVAKMIALAIIWHTWFSDPDGRRTDGERVGAVVYSSSATIPQQDSAHARP
jgi:hypothetical protein